MTRIGFILGATFLGLSAVVFMMVRGGISDSQSTDDFQLIASVPVTVGVSSASSATKNKTHTQIPVTYNIAPNGIFSDAVVQDLFTSGVVGEHTEKETTATMPAPVSLCMYDAGTTPVLQRIILNEIAWMGTLSSASDEWIELRNMTSSKLSLAGWQLQDEAADIKIIFDAGDIIPANGFYLLERTDDATTPMHADRIYTGALGNTNEALRLWSAGCVLEDVAFAKPTWIAGDSGARKTMERDAIGFGWHTSLNANGTPKATNSVLPLATPPPAPDPVEESPPSPSEASGEGGTVSPPSEPPPPSPEEEQAPPDTPTGSLSGSAAHVMISEIQTGTENGGAEDEFIELYNPTDVPISLIGFALKKQSSTGSESNLVSSGAFTGSIPAHGFFLIAHKNYTGTVVKDLEYSANSNNVAYTNNAVVLYDASGVEVDRVTWEEIVKGTSSERKAWNNGVCVSASGSGVALGNGCDTNSASDFEVRITPQPQNKASATEL